MNSRHAAKVTAHKAFIARRRGQALQEMQARVAYLEENYPGAPRTALVATAAKELHSKFKLRWRVLVSWYENEAPTV